MSLLNRFVDDAYSAWLSSAVGCCAPQTSDNSERAPVRGMSAGSECNLQSARLMGEGIEKPMTILHHQPHLIPPPIPEPQYQPASARAWATRTKTVSNRVSFSVKRRVNAYNGLGRPQIGAPTDFRHVQNGFPRETEKFRPLELSIYMPENRLSPLLPHFGSLDEDSVVSFPPAVMTHARSDSALSNFTIRRKPLNSHSSSIGRLENVGQSGIDSFLTTANRTSKPLPARPESVSTEDLIAALQEDLPIPPPRALIRANTESLLLLHRRDSEQVGRVKSILHEKVALEKQLRETDSIIEERKSIYMSSGSPSVYEEPEEPMPELKGSTSQTITRQSTSSSRPTVHIPLRSKPFSEASAVFASPITPPLLSEDAGVISPDPSHDNTHAIPPPPLPLVLQSGRPPIRQKKSFSRVSNWLFPSTSDHSRDISLDSITNMPKPITSRDGFYQCVDLKGAARVSTTSFGTVSVYDSELEELTPPPTLTWSPGSSPREDRLGLERMVTSATFGEQNSGRDRSFKVMGEETLGMDAGFRVSKVGVAF